MHSKQTISTGINSSDHNKFLKGSDIFPIHPEGRLACTFQVQNFIRNEKCLVKHQDDAKIELTFIPMQIDGLFTQIWIEFH